MKQITVGLWKMSEMAVACNICGSSYTLPEDEAGGNLPHVLLCSHIFCSTCLRALKSPQNVITCPECQMDTRIEEGVDGLEMDSRIIGLIYTARMNAKKGHSGDRCKSQRFKSPLPSPAIHTEDNAEGRPDVVKVLDEALGKATENLSQLDKLQKTLSSGIHAQLRKERTRIIREIDEAVDKAKSILQKRRSMLMSKLSDVDLLFTDGQKECKRIEERIKELKTAIQKAWHVRRVPSLETYCNLDQIVETLHIPVDAESYDMSSMSLHTGLRCSLQMDSFVDSLRNCLKITDDSDDCILEEVKVEPFQHIVKSGGVAIWDSSSQSVRGNADPIPKKKSPCRPRFIEETVDDTDTSEIAETAHSSPGPEQRHNGRHKELRRPCKQHFDRPLTPQTKLVHYVMVTHIVNPGNFYVRYMMEQKTGQKLNKKVNEFCSGDSSLFTFSDEIKTGDMLFIYWKEDMWCRVTVTELFQKECFQSVNKCLASEVSRLCVYFQDFGFSKGISIPSDGDLSILNECMRRPDASTLAQMNGWAPLAIKCSLKDIIPADLLRGWSLEAVDEMKSLLGSEAVEMQVFGEDGDALLVDLKKTPMVSLREHLVFMGQARFYSPIVAPGSAPLLFYPSVRPALNTEVNAMVSHVNTPSDFYVQLVENMEYLLLHSKLQDCYSRPQANIEFQIYCPSLSQACIACYDHEWCRVQVIGFPGGRMVEVRYVDFGYRKTLSVKDLRQIKDEFFALPEMAMWCSLNDVVSPQVTWSDEACVVFKDLVEHKFITVVTKKLVPDTRPVPVCLYEIGEDCTGDSIGDILVRNGLAVSSKQSQIKDTQPLETTVWDPPFEEEPLSVVLTPPPPPPPPPVAEELKPNLILPTCVKDIEVRVTLVTSPGNIYVQLLQFDDQLKRIHDTLKSLFSKSEPQEILWEAEMFCAANNTGVWERGNVCSVSTNGVAEVLRCDFGNKVKVHVNNLRPLSPDLIGSFLLECNLSGVRPAGGRSTWTATACDFISHYLTGARAVMNIKDPSTRPVLVSLFCSNRAGQNISFADFLISEGLALKERKAAPISETVFSEQCVLSEKIPEPQRTTSLPQTPPTPSPRINPPPERVQTHSYPPPELPPCGHTLMNISAISEQGVIYAMTYQAVCEFDRLRERLQQHIKTLPRPKSYNWKGVLGCAVMGTDMFWYRGQVQEVIGGHVKVQYVDQGLVESIPVCHVYPMVLCEDVPQLCVPCQINGVLPIGKGWQWDAVVLMKELLLGRSVYVHIIERPEDPCGCVKVEITVDGMALSKIMVHHQYASFDPAIISQEDYVVKPLVPDLDDWDLNTEGLEEPQPVFGIYKELQIPKARAHFPAKVKHIRTPNEVFLCVLDKCEQEQEESLEEALERVNENIENLSLLTDFPIECPCLAEYSDGKYYRAKLMGFSQLTPSVKLLVRHVDFGSDDILPTQKLRQLPASLHHFPCAAVYVKLAGFRPTDVCFESERIPYRPEWSMRAMMEMINLLNGELTAVLTATEPQLTVLLYNAEGKLVHRPLVEKGLADYA
ncbi:RING finger protein 17-like isoform X2 [Carassius carassius]|uniref:RING finger protein 17-like isoform X2 n=1 Tax=Carassius carassius TaxID=217509 RepID=UPI002868E0EB|nr:RING finger protein 17-like isoform X2 [Carassius carassius]